MMHRMLRLSAATLAVMAVAACSGNSNRAGGDSTAAAIADSQPGVNAPSGTAAESQTPSGSTLNDSSQRRDSASNMSMPTEGPNRGRKPPR